MAGLRQLIAHGYNDFERIKSNPHFASLRTREDFGKLLKELEQEEKPKTK